MEPCEEEVAAGGLSGSVAVRARGDSVTCQAAVAMEVVVERIAPNSSHILELQMSE